MPPSPLAPIPWAVRHQQKKSAIESAMRLKICLVRTRYQVVHVFFHRRTKRTNAEGMVCWGVLFCTKILFSHPSTPGTPIAPMPYLETNSVVTRNRDINRKNNEGVGLAMQCRTYWIRNKVEHTHLSTPPQHTRQLLIEGGEVWRNVRNIKKEKIFHVCFHRRRPSCNRCTHRQCHTNEYNESTRVNLTFGP